MYLFKLAQINSVIIKVESPQNVQHIFFGLFFLSFINWLLLHRKTLKKNFFKCIFTNFSKKTNFSLLSITFLVKFDIGFRKIIGNKEVRLNLDLAVLFFRKFFNKIKNLVFFRKKASTQKKKISKIENHFVFYPAPLVKKISKKN